VHAQSDISPQPAAAPRRLRGAARFCGHAGLTLLVVLGFTTIVLVLSGTEPFSAYYHLFIGSLGSWSKLAHVLKAWVPLTLCSCGLLYTFRMGLWNIGVEGQVVMGAIFTTAVLRLGVGSGSPTLFLALSFAGGVAGGALWALLAGYLKAKGGVNEIFAGLGLNFVALGITLWLIFGPWKRPGVASMSGTELFPRELWLPVLGPWRLAPVALLTAAAAIVVSAFILRYTTIGLRLKAIGHNYRAAPLYGLRPGRYILLAMIMTGGLAGLAGTMQVTGAYHRLLPNISSNYGYLALLVVMLANYNVWAAAAVGFFFACLNVGSIQLPLVLKLDSSLSGVIQGALVLAALLVHGWRSRRPPREGSQTP